MVEGISVVVNVILSLKSVINPPLPCATYNNTAVKLCTLGFYLFKDECGAWGERCR